MAPGKNMFLQVLYKQRDCSGNHVLGGTVICFAWQRSI